MSRAAAPVVALVAVAVLVAGCGGAGGSSDISAKAQRALVPYVEAVRQAAATHDHASVQQAVRALKHEVEVQGSRISTARAADIDNAADAVLNAVTPSPSPSTSTTPTQSQTPTQTPTPPPTVTITPTHTVTVSPPASVSPPTPGDTSTKSGGNDDGDS